MKKLYMPTMDELYSMQELGANVYKYLYAKAIEALVVEGVNYPNKGILKSSYTYLREDEAIAHGVCMMFPEEIAYSEVVKYDPVLCQRLISEEQSNLDRLDNLSHFSRSVLSNINIVREVIEVLARELKDNPKYRFTYKDNALLDNIFARRTDGFFMWANFGGEILESLSIIEPAYLVDGRFSCDGQEIQSSVDKYGARYDLPINFGMEYEDIDILSNQPAEVKRLIRCINSNKKNLY